MVQAAVQTDKTTRLAANAAGRHMVSDYWENIFTARERGAQVVWYNGDAVNPFFQAAGIEWVHGEAFSARLAAQRLEKTAQLAGKEYGYVDELCSYARTHLGCAVLAKKGAEDAKNGIVNEADREHLASKLPVPNFFVNAYAGCSTGQQWDEITYRVFGKEVPIFNISMPFLWGSKPDAMYLRGQEWEEATDFVSKQLYALVEFLEQMTGRPFDWDALRRIMGQIKAASMLRREAMAMCKGVSPTPMTFWDWIASVAHINFLPASDELVDYFRAIRDEVAMRVEQGIPAIQNERYRLYFDGIMNWNKLGVLARTFAEHDVAVICGRYTHNAFWQEPHLIDPEDPIRGMAQHYLLCPMNHGVKTLEYLTNRDCVDYGVDGIVFHSTRTCRAFTNTQHLLAKSAQDKLGLPSMFFEGDIADESFYKPEILETRLEALLETIDVRRAKMRSAA
ncbi:MULTISPECIES: 2-hydroxyacyl-CoA dehydratase subunit D [unclassified Sphingomonas]|uniref:2-hydroxyacyl-CoA dehydratase subunit D n=1 Tax=unclassified Sphingomonas TaxID=196159 RepID=UPI00082EC0DA|nr:MULTISPECIES: 2-hydroxyacyl-CoA dehydratase family protein [unclassified Sphingomonas]